MSVPVDTVERMCAMTLTAVTAYRNSVPGPVDLVWRVEPLRLAHRMLQLSNSPGQVCLVPFAGSGTECLAAMREGMHYIGIEIDQTYVEIARERLIPRELL